MTINNLIVSLLTDNKLSGANFVEWKEHINIALLGENSMFVLTEEAPKQPGENETKVVKEKFERWQNANNKARYFMLSSMVDTLKTRFANTLTVVEIINQLTELFRMKGGNKAPISSTAAADTTKPEANIASTLKPKKKKWKNSKKPLKVVNIANKGKKATNPKAKEKRKLLL
ncbi:uncharacterized protein LOC115713491 [Cannabis sativa]|uniref:uncharacterized protein LOC115713491 n=1 Tax=Cannabis sativa TaxID=3483 RepID=UPI0029CA4C2B|nr:uncharacterized protein LOC115713491 [Cannabis sativa]